MKKFLYTIAIILLLFSFQPTAHALWGLEGDAEETQVEEEKSFWETLSDIDEIRTEISEKEAELKFLQESENGFSEEIDNKSDEINNLEESITELEVRMDSAEAGSEEIANLQAEKLELEKEILDLEADIYRLEQEQDDSEELREEDILTTENEIINLEIELGKTKAIATQQVYTFSKRGAVYLLLLLLTFLFGKIAKKAVKRSPGLSPKKQQVLVKIINWGITTAIILAILTLLFSQLLILLPVLALLGTGLAFAVRDVILSVFAWFFIGSDKKYKMNDLIEINGARGRVLDIKLIHTTLKETGQKGPTGRILSLPNKQIFEYPLYNFSSMFQFTWIVFDFLLENGSDVQRTKELLTESIEEVTEEDFKEIEKNLPSLTNDFGIKEESTHVQIFTEITEHGIHIKTRFLVRLPNRHTSSSQISELFLKKIADEPNIKLRFLDRI